MRMRLCVLFLLLFCVATFGFTQGGPPEQGMQQGPPPGGDPHAGMMRGDMHRGMMMHHPDGGDPIAGLMIPPDHILRMAEELNLTDQQKTAIRNEVRTTQPKFTDLQFQLQDQTQAFAKLLHADKTDEKAALAALDQVLDTERQIKRLHDGMIIRVKNMLNAEQLEKLKSMHNMHQRMMQRRPGPGGPGEARPDDGPDED